MHYVARKRSVFCITFVDSLVALHDIFLAKNDILYEDKFHNYGLPPTLHKQSEAEENTMKDAKLRELLIISKKLGDILKQDIVKEALGEEKV